MLLGKYVYAKCSETSPLYSLKCSPPTLKPQVHEFGFLKERTLIP